MNVVAWSFALVLVFFMAVGLFSIRKKKASAEDYLLAGRAVNPWAVGLSAVATGHSGFKFIGLIGFTYTFGLPTVWITIGWFIGDFLAWRSGLPRLLRVRTQQENVLTYASFLGRISGRANRWVTVVAALISLVFLASYAAAQLAAGGKSLQVLLDWPYDAGAYLSAAMIFAYCFAGGIRASIWTDVVQCLVMVAGMYGLMIATVSAAGGPFVLWQSLKTIDPALVSLVPQSARFGFAALLISLVLSGFGVLGQPHIMVRSMTVDSAANMALVRRIYLYLGYSISLAGLVVGMGARVLLPHMLHLDAELIMPTMATTLFHPIFSGLLLAALFSATISTADSQILVCSSALTNDIFPSLSRRYNLMRLATLATVLLVLALALRARGVFALVMFSWGALAASFTPLVVVTILRWRVTARVGVTMMLAGLATSALWRLAGLHEAIYESLPGMLVGGGVYALYRLVSAAGASHTAAVPTAVAEPMSSID